MESFFPGYTELMQICVDHNDDDQEWLGFNLVCLNDPERRQQIIEEEMGD